MVKPRALGREVPGSSLSRVAVCCGLEQVTFPQLSVVAYVIPWPLFVNQGFYTPKCLYSRVDFKNGSCFFSFDFQGQGQRSRL